MGQGNYPSISLVSGHLPPLDYRRLKVQAAADPLHHVV